jgi:hypothetical protein
MFRLHFLVAELLGSVMGCLDCFLGFYSKFIKLHISSSPVLNHSKQGFKVIYSEEKIRMIEGLSRSEPSITVNFSGKADFAQGER